MYALLLSDLEKEKKIFMKIDDYMTKHLTTRSKQEILSMNVTKLKYFYFMCSQICVYFIRYWNIHDEFSNIHVCYIRQERSKAKRTNKLSATRRTHIRIFRG